MPYIFYMHPTENTSAYENLSEFWKISIDICGIKGNMKKNTALLYPFHVSLTSFFDLEKSKINNLINLVNPILSDSRLKTSVNGITPYFVPKQYSRKDSSQKEQYFSAIMIDAPQIQQALQEINTITRDKFDMIKIKTGLHATLYNHLDYETMDLFEKFCGLLPVVRNTNWNDISIILWYCDDNYNWKIVHRF